MNDTPDLSSALAQIAQGATRAQTTLRSDGHDLPLAAIRTAARRRRAWFGTGAGVGAAATVGALALGGAALGIGDGGAAPAGTGGWDVDYAACGTATEVAPDDGPGLALAVPTTSFPTDSNAVVTVASTVRQGGDGTVEQVGRQHTGVALDFTGTVVGVLGVPDDVPADALTPADEDSLALTTTAPLFSCRSKDGTTRLEPGTYLLSVSRVVEVSTGGAPDEQLLTAQWDLTVPPAPTGTDAGALPTTALTTTNLTCGEPLDIADGIPGPLAVGMSQPPMESPGTGLVHVSADFVMTNVTDRAVDVADDGARLVLTRGGTVVGFSSRGGPGFAFEPDTARAGFDSVSYGLGCPAGLMGGDVQSGEYDLWVVVGVEGDPTSGLVAGPWAVDVQAGPDADRAETQDGADPGTTTVVVPGD